MAVLIPDGGPATVTVGAEAYPVPATPIVTLVTEPLVILAVAAALEPPPPLNVTDG